MLQTFKAILTKNQLEWIDDKPMSVTDKPALVYVILLESEPEVYGANETTLNALSEIESGGGEVFESVDELFKDLNN
jgi:hypothetical protein